MKQKEQLFEVILPPTDMLEKELSDVLGGLMAPCNNNECDVYKSPEPCNNNTCRVYEMECPPGLIWDPTVCDCVPIE